MIKIARESRLLTQAELAEKIDLSQVVVCKIEADLYPINENLIEKIANSLSYPIDFFKNETRFLNMGVRLHRKRSTMNKREEGYIVEGDKRGKAIKLAYKDEEFFVPENVYLIGMMNTADRSLAMMDYALRRRFSFFEVEPAFKKEAFRRHLESFIHNGLIVNKVINRLSDLNDKIADENTSGLGKGFCIGHSYFCVEPVEGQSENDWYKSIIKFEICPLLDEYWWDDKSKADNCKKELLKD